MIVIGLTGSIGMGKSVTAEMFGAFGCPVYAADDAVHALYRDPAVAAEIERAFPGSTVDGAVDRDALGRLVLGDDAAIRRLEQLVHPKLRAQEAAFLDSARKVGARAAVLDIPLLLETGGGTRCDVVVVVSAPAEVQRARVLARPGMTEEKFAAILARQMPDAEKRRRADVVIDTSQGIEPARNAVGEVLRRYAGWSGHASPASG